MNGKWSLKSQLLEKALQIKKKRKKKENIEVAQAEMSLQLVASLALEKSLNSFK